MPAFPASVQQVISDLRHQLLTEAVGEGHRPRPRPHDQDPEGRQLGYFGLSRKIVSINHAVVYLGLNTVKHVALAIAAIGSLPRENDAGFDMDDFLLHSLTTTVLTRSLARHMRVPEVEAANFFVAGLLHDIGQVVFAQFKPDEFAKALEKCRTEGMTLHDAEDAILGHDHCEVGAVLCESWSFPESLVSAIRMHHVPVRAVTMMRFVSVSSSQTSSPPGSMLLQTHPRASARPTFPLGVSHLWERL